MELSNSVNESFFDYSFTIINFSINGYNSPCVYILLTNTTEKKTYDRIRDAVKVLKSGAAHFGVLFNLEKAAMSSVSKCYPLASLSEIRFHVLEPVETKMVVVVCYCLNVFSRRFSSEKSPTITVASFFFFFFSSHHRPHRVCNTF